MSDLAIVVLATLGLLTLLAVGAGIGGLCWYASKWRTLATIPELSDEDIAEMGEDAQARLDAADDGEQVDEETDDHPGMREHRRQFGDD